MLALISIPSVAYADLTGFLGATTTPNTRQVEDSRSAPDS